MGSLLLLQFQIILCLHLFFTSFSSSSSLSPPLCHPDQNSALLQLKNSLKVDGWENGTDCCSWPGVTCESTSGHVIGLDLSWRGLEGKINSTSSLFHLTHLQKINLAQNGFYGPLLPSQFGGFVNLTHLNLSWCSFEGDIPSEISYLSKLVSLDLSGNLNLKWTEITWKRLLQNATALREIFLDYTDMSSISLSSLSLITNWSFSSVTLGLSNTNITGYLTSDILCLPNLKELHLYGNTYLQVHVSRLNCNASVSILDLSFCEFQGSLIPSSFSNLTYLTSLTLFDCGLNGSIPSSLSNLQHLTHLDLSSNSIVGSIPSSFSNLQHLTYLDLSNNNLTGAVPASFSKLELLTHLDLSSNELNGSIPSSLWKLQDLVVLDLSYNELSGQLPDIFGGLNKLQTLNLGKNKIQGKLPFSLFTLTQLSILYFSSNKFEGPLPNQIAGFSNLTELYLDDNLLNGTIPSWCLSLPLLKHLNLSSNQFTGNLSEISSYSLLYLNLCGNKIHGDIPQSIFDLVNLTELCLSSDNHGGFVNFPLFSKLQNLRSLTLSGYESISLKSDVNANYTFSNLKMLHLFSNTILDFPKFSGKFPRLLILDLSNNNLQGEMPKWIHDLDSLYHLNLSTNQLTSIENFSWHGLQYLDLSSNLMTNEISSILCNISSLEVVDLSNNYFTGTIPQCLSNLSYLEVLDLRMNKLYGTLPDTFSMNSNLKTLNLGNKFYSPVGNNLTTKHPFPSLIIFDASGNNFSGLLPKDFIENFQAMKNVVHAEVGSVLSYMNSRFYSAISYETQPEYANSLIATVKWVSRAYTKIPTIFAYIDLSENKFEGEIPNVIGEVHALIALNLSHNKLIGSIPQSMGFLTELESLDLSSNMLTGRIPNELTNLNFLGFLNLSSNHLVGQIPRGRHFDTFQENSYQGNMGLCGFPLPIQCNKILEEEPLSSPTNQAEEKFGFGWEPVAIGYGCGTVFGIGLGCCVFSIGKPQWLVRIFGGNPNKEMKRKRRARTN
ncbi:receptor-like protein 7 [Arachis hypogaea]|uniref:receptor-like protein 7 n=1 Tax=Arachis hypogaea TaxID=3818 RepID=UPI0034E7B283